MSRRPHVIESVGFQWARDNGLPIDDAPIRCSCGADTTSGGWERHRGLTVDQERVARNHAAWNERQAAA